MPNQLGHNNLARVEQVCQNHGATLLMSALFTSVLLTRFVLSNAPCIPLLTLPHWLGLNTKREVGYDMRKGVVWKSRLPRHGSPFSILDRFYFPPETVLHLGCSMVALTC